MIRFLLMSLMLCNFILSAQSEIRNPKPVVSEVEPSESTFTGQGTCILSETGAEAYKELTPGPSLGKRGEKKRESSAGLLPRKPPSFDKRRGLGDEFNRMKQSPAAVADNTTDSTEKKVILFLGNSLTAGYGLNPDQAFPALIQQKIDSLEWNFEAINAGLSGETSAGGLRRINWLLKRKIDVLVLALGGNDGLRGIPPEVTRQNLQAIIDRAREKYPEVKIAIAGMEAPPNMGQDFTAQFRAIFPGLAKENNAALIPFLLEGVGGKAELNLADGIHPNAQGHKIVAENVWEVLKPVVESGK